MAMDESAKPNNSGSPDPAAASSEEETAGGATEAQDRAGRMNAAKAFYRAMYAGEDVEPDEFGLAAKPAAGGDEPSGGGRSGPCGNCAYLEQQLTETQAKTAEFENLYKRMAADFENYRRRLDREREEFAGVGAQKAIEAILPALDDLDRAKMMLGNTTDPKAILESLNLVYTRFLRCLDGLGIKPLEVIGEPFDPRNHEPVQEIETNNFADGAVMHELRKGYSYKDKILRPTLVNVASNPSGVVVPLVTAPAETAEKEEAAPETAKEAVAKDESPAAEAVVEAPVAEKAEVEKPVAEKVSAEATAEKHEVKHEAKTAAKPAAKAEAPAAEPATEKVASDVEMVEAKAPVADKSVEASESKPEAAVSDSTDDGLGTLDALNDALKNLVGSEDEKGADTESDGETKDKEKKQTVYDITDSDNVESAEQRSVE